MPGLGFRTALKILTIVGDGAAFPTPRSGASIKGETRFQRGNHAPRSVLFIATFDRLADPTSRACYDRRRAQGKWHNAGLICLAGSRTDVIYAVLRDRKPSQDPRPGEPGSHPPPLDNDTETLLSPRFPRRFAVANTFGRIVAIERLFPYSGDMPTDRLSAVHRLLSEAVDALLDVAGPGAGDDELLSVLTVCEGITRRLDRVVVGAVAALERRGVFTERGYRNPASALADLLGWERFEARRRTVAAEAVGERVGLDGATLPARLPATAEAFATGHAGLRHVEVIARVLGSDSAARLAPPVWAGAEAELAAKAAVYTPTELTAWGAALIEALDADGPEPDERGPAQVNELHLTARRGGGGHLKGRFDDPALYDAIATVIDAKARPLTADDDRTPAQRNAEALAEVCGYVLDHRDVPQRGGERPHLNVLIRLEDLEDRARSAMLDLGGTLSPESLRMLACDAAVIPIVMNGDGQPLDIGRANRTIPDGLRRAVAARDRGCAHPGCGRTASWCEIHHIKEWSAHGETRLDNLVMMCRQHHRLLHHSEWVVRIRDGLPEFVPPRWVDADQTPRRKPLTHLAS